MSKVVFFCPNENLKGCDHCSVICNERETKKIEFLMRIPHYSILTQLPLKVREQQRTCWQPYEYTIDCSNGMNIPYTVLRVLFHKGRRNNSGKADINKSMTLGQKLT